MNCFCPIIQIFICGLYSEVVVQWQLCKKKAKPWMELPSLKLKVQNGEQSIHLFINGPKKNMDTVRVQKQNIFLRTFNVK